MAVQPDDGWVAEHLARWSGAREPEALGELLKWQRDRAFAVARRILGNDAEAEDAVQQAFLKLFRSSAEFAAARDFHAAVYRSVTHSAIDLARNRQARRLVEHAMARHDRPASSSPGETIENREAVRILQQEMETLAPEDRALLTLCCQEGLSLVAAAESLELPRETARDRLARLFMDLRNRLARRGVTLSLLLLLGLFQQGRTAHASEALCAALDVALPGVACSGIAPAAGAAVPAATLLTQAGLSTSIWAGKVWAGLAAVALLSAGAVTYSLTGNGTGRPADSGKAPLGSGPLSREVRETAPVPAPDPVPRVEDPVPPPADPAPLANKKAEDDEEEEKIPWGEVPARIREAVLQAVPDIENVRAEREERKGRIVYDIKGNAGGKFVEIELSEDGRLLKIERKDEEEWDDRKGVPPPVEPRAKEAAVF